MTTTSKDRNPALGIAALAAGLALVVLFLWLERTTGGFAPLRAYELEFLYRIPAGEAAFDLRYLAIVLPASLLLALGVAFLFGGRPFRGVLDRLDRMPEGAFTGLLMVLGAGLVLIVARFVLQGQPVTDDERVYLFQAELLSRGNLFVTPHPLKEFFDNTFIVNDEKWYGKYPPGHPLLLVPGVVAGFPRLVPALLAAVNLLLFYRVAGVYFPRKQARGAALLLLSSPFFLFTGATLLSHTSCLTALLLFAWAAHRSLAGGGGGAALLAGVGAGMAFLIRPYTALLIGLPVAAAWLWALRGRRASLRPWLTALGVATVFALLLLATNYILTGNPLRTGYSEVQGERGGRVLGFGEVIPGYLTHTPVQGVLNVVGTIVRLNFWTWGWPLGWLFVIAALLWSRRSDMKPLWAVLVTTGIGSIFYFSLGVADTGPVKYYELLPVLTLLTVAGLVAFDDRIGRSGRAGLSALAPALVIVSCLLGWGLFARLQIGELRRVTSRIEEPYRAIGQLPEDQRLLIFTGALQTPPFDSWVFSAPNNLPEPEARILYVRDLGDQNRTLIERFADRAPYRLFLGEGRRYELERLSGDEATKRMVQDRLRDARVHLRKLELREGIELIQQATRIDPGSVEAHLLLGWAYEQGRVSRGAEMAYRKALELDPSKAEHWFFLGRFLGRANRLNEALPLLEKAAELDPRSRDIQAALAQVRSGTPPP
jgi:hypothetical protein